MVQNHIVSDTWLSEVLFLFDFGPGCQPSELRFFGCRVYIGPIRYTPKSPSPHSICRHGSASLITHSPGRPQEARQVTSSHAIIRDADVYSGVALIPWVADPSEGRTVEARRTNCGSVIGIARVRD